MIISLEIWRVQCESPCLMSKDPGCEGEWNPFCATWVISSSNITEESVVCCAVIPPCCPGVHQVVPLAIVVDESMQQVPLTQGWHSDCRCPLGNLRGHSSRPETRVRLNKMIACLQWPGWWWSWYWWQWQDIVLYTIPTIYDSYNHQGFQCPPKWREVHSSLTRFRLFWHSNCQLLG